MGEDELAAIEARIRRAFASERWRYDPDLRWVYAALGGIPGDVGVADNVGAADGTFIAQAPADVATLLAEVRRLRGILIEERARRIKAATDGPPDEQALARARDQLRAEGVLPG
jgi:hypothetical protein